MGLVLDKAVPEPKGEGTGAPAEITLEMLNAGALVLSRLKDDVTDGVIDLRDAVELIFRAMHENSASSGSSPTSLHQFRQSISVDDYREMIQQPLGPAPVPEA